MSKLVKAWFQYMHLQFGIMSRSAPTSKVRKYVHIQIQQQFQKLEESRKKQRFKLLQHKKLLLETQLNKQNQLRITHKQAQTPEGWLNDLQKQIQVIQKQLAQQQKQLKQIQSSLVETESQYILITGNKKLIVLNQITYLKHMSMYPTGLVLNPETMKTIENVNYLLEHNLPIPKYKLYEVMPQIFKKQIHQLQQSAQKLLAEKRPVFEAKSSQLINYYQRRTNLESFQRSQLLIQQRSKVLYSMFIKSQKILSKHSDLFQQIELGNTRFRSLRHFYYECIYVKDDNAYTLQQREGRDAVLQAHNIRLEMEEYQKLFQQKIQQLKSQIYIPCYVFQNKALLQGYIKLHNQIFQNSIPFQDSNFIPYQQPKPNMLEIKIREALEKQVKEKRIQIYDGQSKFNKNKSQNKVKLLNVITKVLNQFDNQGELIVEKQQRFQRIQKTGNPIFSLPIERISIELDQMTKMLELNNTDPKKYTIQFFSKYFGIDAKLLQNVFNYVSFPKVTQKGQRKILKFVV